jgi:hypothetical protein
MHIGKNITAIITTVVLIILRGGIIKQKLFSSLDGW